jgi:hypothetical protein
LARGRKRGVAIARGHVDHALTGAQIERFAEALTDDLQCGADHGIIAGGPRGLLTRFNGGEVGCSAGRSRFAYVQHGCYLSLKA